MAPTQWRSMRRLTPSMSRIRAPPLSGDTVSVINGATCNAVEQSGCNQSPATITVGVGPLGIAVNPTTNTVYVTAVGKDFFTSGTDFGDTVSVINGASCDGTDTSGCGQSPAQVTVGPAPWGIAVDPATNSIFVANNDGGDGPASLSVIHGATCDGADTSGCQCGTLVHHGCRSCSQRHRIRRVGRCRLHGELPERVRLDREREGSRTRRMAPHPEKPSVPFLGTLPSTSRITPPMSPTARTARCRS